MRKIPEETLPQLTRDLIRVVLDPTVRVVSAKQRALGDNAIRGTIRSARFREGADGKVPRTRAFLWKGRDVTTANTLNELST